MLLYCTLKVKIKREENRKVQVFILILFHEIQYEFFYCKI